MPRRISRRTFAAALAATAGLAVTEARADEKPKGVEKKEEKPKGKPAATGPVEAPFQRDYEAPKFRPSWRKQQINRQMVQDFVIYAHSELPMVKKLLAKEPALVNATMDWGGGDWETGLGGASHMGRHDIVEVLLQHGARIDIFCAAMMGQLDAVKAFLTLEPKLIDAKGPHGFTLHFHAQVGGEKAEKVLAYLQTVKKLDLKPLPPFFTKKPAAKKKGE